MPLRAAKSKHSPRSSIGIARTTARLLMPHGQHVGWSRMSAPAASACSSPKTGEGSSALRSRWSFQDRYGSWTHLASELGFFYGHAVGLRVGAGCPLPAVGRLAARVGAAGWRLGQDAKHPAPPAAAATDAP